MQQKVVTVIEIGGLVVVNQVYESVPEYQKKVKNYYPKAAAF